MSGAQRKSLPAYTGAEPPSSRNLDATNTYRDSRATGGNASGTSWSAPIVAGMVARILQNNTGYSVDDVYNAVMSRTTADLDPTELNPPNVTCPNDGQPCTTNNARARTCSRTRKRFEKRCCRRCRRHRRW